MKNKIILIGGYCAAGKSKFAHRLSRELQIPCFNNDTIDETMCDAFGSDSKIVEMGSIDAAFAVMLHIAERLLQVNIPCILENVFVLDELKYIKKLFKKYNCEYLLFVLKGNPEVMFERYGERDKAGERHWIHESADDENSKSWFINDMSKLYGLDKADIGEKIIVDTTSFDKINYNDLIASAKRFINEVKYDCPLSNKFNQE